MNGVGAANNNKNSTVCVFRVSLKELFGYINGFEETNQSSSAHLNSTWQGEEKSRRW